MKDKASGSRYLGAMFKLCVHAHDWSLRSEDSFTEMLSIAKDSLIFDILRSCEGNLRTQKGGEKGQEKV